MDCLRIWFLLLISMTSVAFSNDLIIDRNGNEISAKVLSVTDKFITYQDDSTGTKQPKILRIGQVFMVKYEDGRKLVFSKSANTQPDTVPIKSRIAAAVLANGGTFGLFNVDNVFTKASYTLGATPLIEYRLNRTFAVGAECMVLFGKPMTNDEPRLLMNMNLRSSARFVVTPTFFICPVVAAGFSLWPEASGDKFLDSTFLDSRTGWDARAALCFEYWISERVALDLEVGYSASSSECRNVWITHDMMLVGFGPRMEF